MEHVVVTMTVQTDPAGTSSRGDIMITLTSPSGTQSTLLSHRDNDDDSGGYDGWPFMSVMFWGEDPTGDWTLSVFSRSTLTNVYVTAYGLEFYGVSSIPDSVDSIPDQCDSLCKRGCSGEGSNACDSCVNLRNAYTLECIDSCPLGYTKRNEYCYDPTLPTEECFSPLKFKGEGKCL